VTRSMTAQVPPRRRATVLAVVALLSGAAAALLSAAAAPPQPAFDLLVRGGLVVDGSGGPARRADVAVRDGRIVRVGRLDGERGAVEIDATGLVVAPGFIDVHTHADDLADHPLAENFVHMGVTTVVAGNCGSSALDVGAALQRIRATGTSVNFATLVGHNTVRRAVLGTANRPPDAAELQRMRALVWKAMADGAVGFSTGLQYIPGAYASLAEIIELARVAAGEGGLYATHMRNEGTEIEAALDEAIRVGRAAGCRVQVSHLKIDSPSRWGASAQVLAMLDAARRAGLDIRADQYAYTAGSSSLAIRFPAWALEGGPAAIAERLNDPSTWARIKAEMRRLLAERGFADLSWATVAAYAPDPSLEGLSMKAVAERLVGSASADAQLEAARTMMLRGGASMVYHFMSEEDLRRIMRHPMVAVASDAGVLEPGQGVPHPRGYGNTARVLARYVREARVLSLEEAIRKMTALPAEHFRFAGRGRVREGDAADLVVFDPAHTVDTATYERPHQYPEGIRAVVVNGVVVVRDGRHTGARPGTVLTLAPASSR
jgi:N-acyl-D-amino-acid deacylase